MADARAGKEDHVVIDFAGPRPTVTLAPEEQMVCRCMHCGHRYVLALPCSLSMAAAVCKQYGKEHRRCRPPPKG